MYGSSLSGPNFRESVLNWLCWSWWNECVTSNVLDASSWFEFEGFPNEGCRQKVIINMSRQKIQGLRSRLVRSVWRLDLCSASLHGQRVGSSMTESASESCNEDLTHPNDDRNAGMPLYGLSVIMILNRFVATNIPPGPQWILWCFVGQGRWM